MLYILAPAAVAGWAAAASSSEAPSTASSAPPERRRFAVVTAATDEYYAQGALVTLHSAGLHLRPPKGGPPDVDLVLLTAGAGLPEAWRRRFKALGARVEEAPQVQPSPAVWRAMQADRTKLQTEGLLEVLQPVPYGGAFLKVHAWDPGIFGGYEKVVLVDGDIVVKRSIRGLLRMDAISASADLMDAFNYGVVVLRPDAGIHGSLVRLLSEASSEDISRYSTRKANEAGFCDQTLVAGFLAAHHGPVHLFEDLRPASRADPRGWVLSTEYNLVVSYRAAERCEDPKERKRVESARIVHFANNWIHFGALALDRDAAGRIDSPRCYRGAFRYWHDVHHHALALTSEASWRRGLAGKSCIDACSPAACLEDQWPASRGDLESVLVLLGGAADRGAARCSSIREGAARHAPSQSAAGACSWRGRAGSSQRRCSARSDAHQRFCPCARPPEAEATLPPPVYERASAEDEAPVEPSAVEAVFTDFQRVATASAESAAASAREDKEEQQEL